MTFPLVRNLKTSPSMSWKARGDGLKYSTYWNHTFQALSPKLKFRSVSFGQGIFFLIRKLKQFKPLFPHSKISLENICRYKWKDLLFYYVVSSIELCRAHGNWKQNISKSGRHSPKTHNSIKNNLMPFPQIW